VVEAIDQADDVAERARDAGFVVVDGPLWCLDRDGVPHPEAVVVDADPGRPTNVNIRAVSAPIWRETLLFRDWLRANPAARGEYERLKRSLSERPAMHVDDYGSEKVPWISAANRRAEEWARTVDWRP
jgi:dephospho-CoA kinase